MKLFVFVLTLLLAFSETDAKSKLCKSKRTKNLRKRMNGKKCKANKDCPPDYVCWYQKKCVSKKSLPPPVQCGPTLCGAGQVCCNKSCGICSNPGGACSKQFCRPPQPKSHTIPKFSEPSELECNLDKDCPSIQCIKPPCPSFVCKDHQCILEAVIEQCKSDLDCPGRDNKCIGGQCLRVEILPPPEFVQECEDRYDCPQVRCMAGAPCPTFECIEGECVAEYNTFPVPPKEATLRECKGSNDCPQPLCKPGAPCLINTCVEGICISETVELEPIFPPKEIQCSSDFQCPQPTCPVGTPCPFYVCEENKCVAKYNDQPEQETVSCGPNTCKGGDVCCNASCGICTPPGGFCTQQACNFFAYEKCNIDSDCSKSGEHCIEGKCSKPIQSLPSTAQCKRDFDCPQPLCTPGARCPIFACNGGACVAEYTGSGDILLKSQPGIGLETSLDSYENDAFVECNVDGDCPPIDCSKKPCPCSVCIDRKCTIRGH